MHNEENNTIIDKNRALKPVNAIISVSNKSGLEDLAKKLSEYDINLLSTGGTANAIRALQVPVMEISEYTGFPEMMDGRVKTLNPMVHAGILANRNNEAHKKSMDDHKILSVDLVIVNLYPFEETIKNHSDKEDICIENVDIGGPAMIRSAAKNFDNVAVVTSPADYALLLKDLEDYKGHISYNLRRQLAAVAFARTASYDALIARWFSKINHQDSYPRYISFAGEKKQTLRYGENPHQNAAIYHRADEERPGVTSATLVQGKELSYNNINDTDAAFELVAEFKDPAVVIIKHANPCGAAVAKDTLDAYRKALQCDPVSAYGGIIALNRPLGEETAAAIIDTFCEVIIAPSIEPAAISVLKKKENIRVLTTGKMPDPGQERLMVKSIAGGLLVQSADDSIFDDSKLEVVTEREPTKIELDNLIIASKICKHVKSNAIVFVKDRASVGIGAGQMSRVDSVHIAVRKSEQSAQSAGLPKSLTEGSVAASDAFFPFPDALLAAAEAGATAFIQPGGSMRDQDVIRAANEKGLAMVFSGIRNFNH